jgi:hypothetical protein
VKVTVKGEALVVLAALEDKTSVGAVVSMTRALLAPRELLVPGVANVRIATLPAASTIDPPLRTSEVVVV